MFQASVRHCPARTNLDGRALLGDSTALAVARLEENQMPTDSKRPRNHPPLEASIIQIDAMDRSACLERWNKAFGHPPPKYVSIRFMKRVLIWNLQCKLLGGLSTATQRTLKRALSGKVPAASTKPGSRLVREWNGRTYQVEVTGDGYVMDGKTYRSLSAIARRITGARWSGPRFFGVGS